MKYFKLTDSLNSGTIVLKKDDGYFYHYSFGKDIWVKTAIMTNYHWADSDLYGLFEEISENEATDLLAQQRGMFDKLYDLALQVSQKAHEGQYDKGGQPYIQHPIRVADSLDDVEEKIVALLHDVIEDSQTTLDQLLNYGFTNRIVNSIRLLTKTPNVSYDDYLRAVKKDNSAWKVKMADLKDNLDISRIPNPSDADYEKLEKYKSALNFLESGTT